MSKHGACLSFCFSLLLLILAAPASRAAIPEQGSIRADITHSFIVGNTTLPPGHYDFRMIKDTDEQIMSVANANHSTAVEFLVRPSVDNHRPTHTELVFNRYGKTEILRNIYVGGQKSGLAVVTASREEARLKKDGQKPDTHTEVQNH